MTGTPASSSADGPLVLGIETSCDETGIGIVRGHTLLADAVASSVEEHARFGGVVPEVASRAHLEAMVPMLERAADTAGIRVIGMRYAALACCGVLCGFAGAYLSIAQNAGFTRNMTAGKGFIALAALVFAKWRPVPVMWACLLFGALDAVAIRLQGQEIPGIGILPVQLMQAVPYILTVALLAGFIGKATPPKAGGIPYVKER